MNVLFHCFEFPPQAGGVGSYIINMAAALQSAGHRAVVVTSRVPELPEEESCPCGTIYRTYTREQMYSPRLCDAVLSIARNHQIDLIEGADHYGEAAKLIRTKRRPPILVKIHGSNPIRILQESHVMYGWQRWTVRLAQLRNLGQTWDEQFSMEHADMALSPSLRMLTELRKQGIRLPEKIGVVPNPIRANAERPLVESLTPSLLMVARIDIGKGIQYIPRMLSRLIPEFPALTLEIAGDDSYARGIGSLKQWLIRQMGALSANVRFLGKLDVMQLDEAYRRAWVVVAPSRWDNFPTVVLESMARGKAVVASPNGGMPEILEHTGCRTVSPDSDDFAEQIASLLRDPEARRRAGKSLRDKALTAYGGPEIARRYLEFVSA